MDDGRCELRTDDNLEANSGPPSSSGNERPSQFCLNCCAPSSTPICIACGHCRVFDSDLLSPSSTVDLAERQLAQEHLRITMASKLLPVRPTLVAFDNRMLLHRAGLWTHAERPERLHAVMGRLESTGLLAGCKVIAGREATDEELLRVHTPRLLNAVRVLSDAETAAELEAAEVLEYLGPDTLGNRHTHHAARIAAGTAAEVAVRVMRGEVGSALAVVRPPGHNAAADQADAGNFFNNAAVAAAAARSAGARRVMIVDWDIHHASGTQSIFEDNPNVLVVSLHRRDSGFYPGSGLPEFVGKGRAAGKTINIAWQPVLGTEDGTSLLRLPLTPPGDGDYLAAFQQIVLPVAAEFNPDLIIVSAGFDAAEQDSVGHYAVTPSCFGRMTADLKAVAPVVMLLEGGYNLKSTSACVEACLRALMGGQPPKSRVKAPTLNGWVNIFRTMFVQQEHWNCLQQFRYLELASQQQHFVEMVAAAQRQAGGADAMDEHEHDPPAAAAGASSSAQLRADVSEPESSTDSSADEQYDQWELEASGLGDSWEAEAGTSWRDDDSDDDGSDDDDAEFSRSALASAVAERRTTATASAPQPAPTPAPLQAESPAPLDGFTSVSQVNPVGCDSTSVDVTAPGEDAATAAAASAVCDVCSHWLRALTAVPALLHAAQAVQGSNCSSSSYSSNIAAAEVE